MTWSVAIASSSSYLLVTSPEEADREAEDEGGGEEGGTDDGLPPDGGDGSRSPPDLDSPTSLFRSTLLLTSTLEATRYIGQGEEEPTKSNPPTLAPHAGQHSFPLVHPCWKEETQ